MRRLECVSKILLFVGLRILRQSMEHFKSKIARSVGINLSLALGLNCGHTFVGSRFLLSRIYGDVPACD